MNKLNATAFVAFLFTLVLATSCKKDPEARIYSNSNIQMSAGQAVPSNTTSATGTISASYNTTTKTLTYTVNYTGLTGAPTAIHVHGLAAPGFPAPIVQVFTSGFVAGAATGSGSFTNSLFADGLVVKEEDILAGQYYIDLHTATYPATGAPQIRGQITLQ
jgi:hypothetical protein